MPRKQNREPQRNEPTTALTAAPSTHAETMELALAESAQPAAPTCSVHAASAACETSTPSPAPSAPPPPGKPPVATPSDRIATAIALIREAKDDIEASTSRDNAAPQDRAADAAELLTACRTMLLAAETAFRACRGGTYERLVERTRGIITAVSHLIADGAEQSERDRRARELADRLAAHGDLAAAEEVLASASPSPLRRDRPKTSELLSRAALAETI